jgi:two-component SAPR family response regulator
VVEFAVLGPVAVRHDGRELPLGGPKQRGLLAILLLHANEVVSRDRLIDGLWGERPPPTAAHTLDNYVSRLRKALGEARLSTRPPGYMLRVEGDELDLDRFERLFREGREDDRFCDPRLDRLMRRATALEATDAHGAAAAWADVDRRAVDAAGWVPLLTPREVEFVSSRVRNYQYHPLWGALADQFWLR